uniref:Uncharacterized protein n=1 Tax=Physcomitrium patens TaxID=3218 RepID=A0A2K1KEM6_PHYPA|nr:hypothetical protein PHYPA_008609 [Physcomitrium patens]
MICLSLCVMIVHQSKLEGKISLEAMAPSLLNSSRVSKRSAVSVFQVVLEDASP